MFNRLFVVTAIAASCVLSVRADSKDDVTAAAKKLADSPNYSWKTTTEGGGNRGGGSTEGKTEKDGFTYLTIAGRNATIEYLFKGEKGAVKIMDAWKSFEEAASGDAGQPNPGRRAAAMAKNFKSPAVLATDLAGKAKDLAKADDAIAGTLPEDAAKELMTVGGGRRGGANANAAAPTVSNAKGTVKFWTKDGVLTKLQYTVQGTMNRNGNDTEVNRTTTVEISGVGSTKIDAPAEAKTKAGA